MINKTDTVVAIGCSTDSDYDFLIPLTALFWRDLIGHCPRVFLVGSEEDRHSGRLSVSLRALRHHGIEHFFVGRVEGYQDATVAQNVRHHAAADPFIAGEQWVMLSDADLWPLRREFYHQHSGRRERVVCLYANGDHFQGKAITLAKFEAGENFQSIPTCHVTMRARDWRSVYDLSPGDVIGSTVKTLHAMDPWMTRCKDKNLARWCCDQWYVTERLCRQHWFPSQALMVERRGHPPMDRYDRSLTDMWNHFDPIWTDAHLLKNPSREESWRKIWPIVDCLLPQHAEWAQRYWREYVA